MSGEPLIQKGIFGCSLDGYIVFFTDKNSNEESPTYEVKIIDLSSNKQTIIAQDLPFAHCEKLSCYEFAYTNGTEIFCYNTHNKKIKSIAQAKNGNKITGFKGSSSNDSLSIFQVDYKTNKVFVNIISTKTNKVFFEKSISLNQNETENVFSTCYWVEDAFVFSLQDKLYSIIFKNHPEFFEICNRLDGFAIDNLNVVFYQFITDEKTEARFFNLKTCEISTKIDQSLDQKIYDCSASNIITAVHNGKYTPYYVICNIPYLFIEKQWKKVTELILFEDNQLKINYAEKNGLIDETNFIYTKKE